MLIPCPLSPNPSQRDSSHSCVDLVDSWKIVQTTKSLLELDRPIITTSFHIWNKSNLSRDFSPSTTKYSYHQKGQSTQWFIQPPSSHHENFLTQRNSVQLPADTTLPSWRSQHSIGRLKTYLKSEGTSTRFHSDCSLGLILGARISTFSSTSRCFLRRLWPYWL